MRAGVDDVLPPGWRATFEARVDFEQARSMLDGFGHFYAEAMRGRALSLELRTDEAFESLQRALSRARVEGEWESPLDLVRVFDVEAFQFENGVLAETPRVDPSVDPSVDPPRAPGIPSSILSACPRLASVWRARVRNQAVVRLLRRECEEARRLFLSLRSKSPREDADPEGARTHLGLAAAYDGLGQARKCARELDHAARSIRSSGTTLERARSAAVMSGFRSYLGDERESGGWLGFIERLPCPPPTKMLFAKWRSRVKQRCETEGRLVPM